MIPGSGSAGRIDVDLENACREEVLRLHEFFVQWFAGDRENTDANFEHVAGVLHPDFSMVPPSGATINRRTALEQIRSAHASATGAGHVDIEIVDYTALAVAPHSALVSYQERQLSSGVLQNRRISTAYFVIAPNAPHGVQWYRLHETLLADS